MTDVEVRRQSAICEAAGVREIEDVSDGFHTFRQLYYQRMMLFATIIKQNRDKAWKSLRHEDGELCFGGGWFIVGIDTPEGSYTYHYEDNFYTLFDCVELKCGKHWDGHTEKDVTRLLSLEQKPCDYYDTYNKTCRKSEVPKEPCEDAISRQAVDDAIYDYSRSCDVNYQQIMEFIEKIPSVTPQQKIGHWIFKNDNVAIPTGYFQCSECNSGKLLHVDNYCPSCGAKMESEDK